MEKIVIGNAHEGAPFKKLKRDTLGNGYHVHYYGCAKFPDHNVIVVTNPAKLVVFFSPLNAADYRPSSYWYGGLAPIVNYNRKTETKFNFMGGQTSPIDPRMIEKHRTLSDVKFLLRHAITAPLFCATTKRTRTQYVSFPTDEIKEAVLSAASASKAPMGHVRIGSFDPMFGELTVDQIRALGARVVNKVPTVGRIEDNKVIENFNWGCNMPREATDWISLGAGWKWHGNKGCNSGWVLYT